MPIKGWSDNNNRVPRLGKIYLGVKLDNRPKAVDYFIVPEEVKKVYGEQPKELDIVFHADDIDDVMPSWLKRYGDQAGLICRGDGEKAYIKTNYMISAGSEYGVKYDPKTGLFTGPDGKKLEIVKGEDKKDRVGIPCLYRNCTFYKKKKCKEVAILNVILNKVPGVLGVYSLDTGSINTYNNIKSGLLMLRKMFNRVSLIRGLRLKVKMQEAHPEIDGGKNVKTKVPVCYITMGDYTLDDLMGMVEQSDLLTVRHLLPGATIDVEPINEEEKPDLLYPEEETGGNDTVDGTTQGNDTKGTSRPAASSHNPPQARNFERAKQQEDKQDSKQPPKEASQQPQSTPQTNPDVRALPERGKSGASNNGSAQQGVTSVRLAERIPIKTVNMHGIDYWFFTAERNTRDGLLKGKLFVPKQIADEDYVKNLKLGDVLKVTSESAIQSKQDFIITATSIEVSNPAARAS